MTADFFVLHFSAVRVADSRSQWPRGLRRGSAAVRLLGLWVQIPHGVWTSVVCVVCSQVEVPETDWSLVRRSSTERGLSNGVWSWILDKGKTLGHWGLLRHGTKNDWCKEQITTNLLLNSCTISSYVPYFHSNLLQGTLNLFRYALVIS